MFQGTGVRHALKVLREPSPAQQFQLLQEAETLSKLSNPKVVKFYGQNFEVQTISLRFPLLWMFPLMIVFAELIFGHKH